jgi:predicted RNA polymerase sigma factor
MQAAIAALHVQPAEAADTDWVQIAGLYLSLERLVPTGPVRLSRVVAVAHAFGPDEGLALLSRLDRAYRLSTDRLTARRTYAVRAHLLELNGDREAAACYRAAAELTENAVERDYLLARADAAT